MKLFMSPQFINDLKDGNNNIRVFYYDLSSTKYTSTSGELTFPSIIVNDNNSLSYRLSSNKIEAITYNNLLQGLTDLSIEGIWLPASHKLYINTSSTDVKSPLIPTTRISPTKFLLNLDPVSDMYKPNEGLNIPDTLYIFYEVEGAVDPFRVALIIRSENDTIDNRFNSGEDNYIELDLTNIVSINANVIIGSILDEYPNTDESEVSGPFTIALPKSEIPVVSVKHNLVTRNNLNIVSNIEYPNTPTNTEIINPYKPDIDNIYYGLKDSARLNENQVGLPQSIDSIISRYIGSVDGEGEDNQAYCEYPLLYRFNVTKIPDGEDSNGRVLIDEDEDLSYTRISTYKYTGDEISKSTSYSYDIDIKSPLSTSRGLEEIYYMNRNAIRLLGKVLSTYSGDDVANATNQPIYNNEQPISVDKLNTLLVDAPTQPNSRELYSINLGQLTHLTVLPTANYGEGTNANSFTDEGQYYINGTTTEGLPSIQANASDEPGTGESIINATTNPGLINTLRSNVSNVITQIFTTSGENYITVTSDKDGEEVTATEYIWKDSIYIRSANNTSSPEFTKWSRAILDTDKDVFTYTPSVSDNKNYIDSSRSVKNAERLQGVTPNTSSIANTIIMRDSNASINVNGITANSITTSTNITTDNVTANNLSINTNSSLLGTTTIGSGGDNTLGINVNSISVTSNTIEFSNEDSIDITSNSINITLNTIDINASTHINIDGNLISNILFDSGNHEIKGGADNWKIHGDSIDDIYIDYYDIGKYGIVDANYKVEMAFDTSITHKIDRGVTVTQNISTLSIATGTDKITTINGTNIETNLPIKALSVETTSTRASKEDITKCNINAIELLNSVNVVNFKYKSDKNKVPHIGFIADDTEPILSGNHTTMDHQNCIGVLIKAVQELNEKIDRK